MVSHSSNNPVEPITKEQLEKFGAQMMVWFDNRIHRLIQHLLTLVQPPNGILNGTPNGDLNGDLVIEEN